MKNITVTFELSERQWESLQTPAKLEPGWHMCDLLIRYNGKDFKFEADYMRAFFIEVRKHSKHE